MENPKNLTQTSGKSYPHIHVHAGVAQVLLTALLLVLPGRHCEPAARFGRRPRGERGGEGRQLVERVSSVSWRRSLFPFRETRSDRTGRMAVRCRVVHARPLPCQILRWLGQAMTVIVHRSFPFRRHRCWRIFLVVNIILMCASSQ